jgi:hypothetical protein
MNQWRQNRDTGAFSFELKDLQSTIELSMQLHQG